MSVRSLTAPGGIDHACRSTHRFSADEQCRAAGHDRAGISENFRIELIADSSFLFSHVALHAGFEPGA